MVLVGHEGDVYVLKYLPTGDLVSGSEDASIKIWNIKTGECQMTFDAHSDWIWCLQIISKNELASGNLNSFVNHLTSQKKDINIKV